MKSIMMIIALTLGISGLANATGGCTKAERKICVSEAQCGTVKNLKSCVSGGSTGNATPICTCRKATLSKGAEKSI